MPSIRIASASAQEIHRTTDLIDANSVNTMTAWVKLVSDINAENTFNQYLCGAGCDMLETDTDGTTLSTFIDDGVGGSTRVNGSALTVGKWYFIAGQRVTNALYRVYLNNVLDISNTRSVAGRAATSKMLIGAYDVDDQHGNFCVAYPKYFQALLTLDQIANEQWYVVPQYRGAVHAWYPCLPTANAGYKDGSGKGRDWTPTNSPTDEDGPPGVSWDSDDDDVFYAPAAAGVSVPVLYHQLQQQGIA